MKTPQHKGKSEKTEGEHVIYFLLHYTVSTIFFFGFTLRFGIYEIEDYTITYLFTLEFLELIGVLFCISILCTIIGRTLAYALLWVIHTQFLDKTIKNFRGINTGINKITIYKFIIMTILSSFFFAIGFITILQDTLFDEKTLGSLIIVYLLVKLGTFAFVNFAIK